MQGILVGTGVVICIAASVFSRKWWTKALGMIGGLTFVALGLFISAVSH